jgi:hypothetical protein
MRDPVKELLENKILGQNTEQSSTQAVVPPMRERLGDPNRMAIPLTYPGKREHLEMMASEEADNQDLAIYTQRRRSENTG